MAKGDLFKRSLEAGTSFLDMTRERAEVMVKEWVDAGDLGRGRAQKAVEQVLERSRKASDELRAMVRKEIGDQLAALGVATREDIARLEAKIDAPGGPSGAGIADVPPSPPPSTGVSTGAAQAAAASAERSMAAPRKAAARKATATKVPVKKVAAKRVTAKKAIKVTRPAAPRKAPPPGAGPPPGA